MSEIWEEENWTTFTIWDIDRAFQQATDAYEQVLLKGRRKRTKLQACFGLGSSDDDALAKSLVLGRHVQDIMDLGRNSFGKKFEKGDSTCHAILSAQLLRTQQEIYIPLLDYSLARTLTPLVLPAAFTISIITSAKAIRRACLNALRDQYDRLQRTLLPLLPPPRFSVNFCPFAAQIQKERSQKSFLTRKVRPHDRYDERETCPYCDGHISVSAHSGLPDARRHLFQSHLKPEIGCRDAKFACTGCYKTFDSSYGFLDHVFQKEIGSERSCQKRWTSCLNLNQVYIESEPKVVEACLRNCVNREVRRLKRMTKEWDMEKTGML